MNTPTKRCTRCHHPVNCHKEHFSENELRAMAIDGFTGCIVEECDCAALEVAPDAQTPAVSRMKLANPQQIAVIERLALALGQALQVRWDALPTGLTTGLKFSEMGVAAHCHSLGRLLAGSTEHIPDHGPELEELMKLCDEMLRHTFTHARAELKERAARSRGESRADTELAETTPVPAPPSKDWLM